VNVFLHIGPFTIVNMTEKIGLFKHYIIAWVGKNKEIKKENFSKNNQLVEDRERECKGCERLSPSTFFTEKNNWGNNKTKSLK
jgi:hypothetical protein